jgi:hypothetical protein
VSSSPVVIRSYPSAAEAQLAQAVLEAHGIPSMLLRDDMGGMQPTLTALSGVRLLVRHDDAVEALRVLDADPADAPGEGSGDAA